MAAFDRPSAGDALGAPSLRAARPNHRASDVKVQPESELRQKLKDAGILR
jgi:hypothetical protein